MLYRVIDKRSKLKDPFGNSIKGNNLHTKFELPEVTFILKLKYWFYMRLPCCCCLRVRDSPKAKRLTAIGNFEEKLNFIEGCLENSNSIEALLLSIQHLELFAGSAEFSGGVPTGTPNSGLVFTPLSNKGLN